MAPKTFRTRIALTTGLVLALGACALLPFGTGPKPERELRVRVRNMAFYLDNDSTTPNPVIKVRAGERIRLRLVSDDPGFTHDFAIHEWDVRTPLVRGEERTSIVFRVPEKPGSFTYLCTLHAAMMKGTIEVVPGEVAQSPGA
jgi:plastocyanin